jgi:hypothetical protein
MPQHLLSLFQIQNSNNFRFSYRLVEIDSAFEGAGGDRDEIERNRHLLRNKVGYREMVPVGLLRVNGKSMLAIPANHDLKEQNYQLIPHDVRLRPRDEVTNVDGIVANEIDAAVRDEFLRFSLGSPLRDRDDIWSATTTSYYAKSPINEEDDSRDVDVYRGFGYRIVEQDGELFVAVRLLHKYVDYRFIVDRRQREGIEQLRLKRFLYLYGQRWYPVQLTAVLAKSISEQTFIPEAGGDPISVFDWTKRENGKSAPPWIQALDPRSLAITYKSVGNEKMRYGAVALCKRMMSNNDDTARGVHKLSILNPHDRALALSATVRDYLSDAKFNGIQVRVDDRLLRVERKLFSIPRIRFGQNYLISVAQRDTDGIDLGSLPKARMDALLSGSGGVAVVGPPSPQHLLLPLSLDRAIGSTLRDRVEKAMQALLKTGYTIQQGVFDDTNCRSLRQQLHAIKNLVDTQSIHGRGILVLPSRAHPRLHDYVKWELKDTLRVQCVDAGHLRSYFATTPRGTMQVSPNATSNFRSYIRYVTVGLLLASGHKPWVLDEPMHFEASVALDVFKGTSAFTFMADGGRVCFTKWYGSKGKERVSRSTVSQAITENLPALIAETRTKRLDRFVLRRDGLCFDSEWNGLLAGIDQLGLPYRTELAAVEVHKMNSCGFRLMDDDGSKALNPEIGAWHAFDNSSGIVCTTGAPHRLRGTANPLFCRIAYGDTAIEDALRDVFWQSLLCWPVPDRYIRLPIDVKLCDDELSVVAAQPDDEEDHYDDENEFEPLATSHDQSKRSLT